MATRTSVGWRILAWLELGVGGLLLALGGLSFALGVLTGHRDPHHGGIYPMILGVMLGGIGLLFGVAGLALRRQQTGWYLQMLPATAVGWILWDVISH
jgi:hypothetical protein